MDGWRALFPIVYTLSPCVKCICTPPEQKRRKKKTRIVTNQNSWHSERPSLFLWRDERSDCSTVVLIAIQMCQWVNGAPYHGRVKKVLFCFLFLYVLLLLLLLLLLLNNFNVFSDLVITQAKEEAISSQCHLKSHHLKGSNVPSHSFSR